MYVNNFAYVVGLNVVSCQVRTWLWCSGVHLWCVLSSAGPINQYSQYIQVMRLNQLSWSGSCALISLRCVHFLNGNCLHAKPIYLSRANISIQKSIVISTENSYKRGDVIKLLGKNYTLDLSVSRLFTIKTSCDKYTSSDSINVNSNRRPYSFAL